MRLLPGADAVLDAVASGALTEPGPYRLQLQAERLLLVAGFDELICLDNLDFAFRLSTVRLGVPAYQRFAFDDALAAEADGAGEITHLSYGHPLVESLIEAARQVPACARLYVNAVRLDKRGLADLAHQVLSFPNARLVEVEDQTESRALGHYVRFDFKAALITDEKRERLLAVLMDAQGGYAVKELAEIERLTTLETKPGFEHLPVMPPVWLPEEEPLSRQALEGLLERAKRAALSKVRTAFIKTYTSRRPRQY